MRASGVFLKAGSVMKERGHARNILVNDHGAVCVSGAVRCALVDSPNGWSDEVPFLLDRVAHVVGLASDDENPMLGNSNIVDWNNYNASGEQVIAALDAAAVVALQEEGVDLDSFFGGRS